jgi:hypothetical protein
MNFTIETGGKAFEWGEQGEGVKGLYEYLQSVPDKRKRRGIRYPLAVILAMVIVAKLSGEDEVRGIAEWLKHRSEAFASALGLKRQATPHATTISRVLSFAFEIDALEQVVAAYSKARVSEGEQLALDGKALRLRLVKRAGNICWHCMRPTRAWWSAKWRWMRKPMKS